MLPTQNRTEEPVVDLGDDEFVARLRGLVRSLDDEARSSLLFALVPVPGVAHETPSPAVVELAVAHAADEGVLRSRTAGFLREHPALAKRLFVGGPGDRRVVRRASEIGFWVVGAVVAAFVAFGLLGAPRSNPGAQGSHGRLVLVPGVTPLAPPLDVRFTATPRHKGRRLRPSAAPLPAASPARFAQAPSPKRTPKPAARRPQPRATKPAFHNIDFSGYFVGIRRFLQTAQVPEVADDPTPTPSPSPRPRVHSLFGPIFGH